MLPVDDRGVVPGLMPGPALAVRVAVLGGADPPDQRGRTVLPDGPTIERSPRGQPATACDPTDAEFTGILRT
jgi:hypothetical protein